VLIHDAVRPLVTKDIITNIIKALDKHHAIDVVIPAVDTIVISDGKKILRIPDRKYLYHGQTPQGFRKQVILQTHQLAEKEGFENATDDCSLVLRYALCDVYAVEGSITNVKFTYNVDYYVLDRLFQLKNEFILNKNIEHNEMPQFFSGFGYFVAPSRTEAQGVAMCEAMACGLPVIATNVGGIPEFVKNGINGILVPPENAHALRKGIRKLLNDMQLYDSLSENGSKFVEKKLSNKRIYNIEHKIFKLCQENCK